MMLAAVEAVTQPDPVWESRRYNSDVAAKAATRESIHNALPRVRCAEVIVLRYRKSRVFTVADFYQAVMAVLEELHFNGQTGNFRAFRPERMPRWAVGCQGNRVKLMYWLFRVSLCC